ncbi:hypothetical protein AUC68_02945 [Methyloceanibacter methanicus]|uniref:Uncharacterized protein n=2 Tax=Methyloceanibacter methanicus TaxID=1774968 RepID=A0A1E3W3L4_9HYPH|nr:hypothetical protein AUC68_02945 [Methyloceanibacter methanicus]
MKMRSTPAPAALSGIDIGKNAAAEIVSGRTAALIRAAHRRRSIKVTGFVRRQIAAERKALDQA